MSLCSYVCELFNVIVMIVLYKDSLLVSRYSDVANMAACDFCPLVFHIDCLNPPMVSPPTALWMCPNHPHHYEVL